MVGEPSTMSEEPVESEIFVSLSETTEESDIVNFFDPAKVQDTFVDSLPSIQAIRCNDKSCNCGRFHCPLCDTETFTPVHKMALAKDHTALHWKNRVDHKGKYIVQCLKPCDKGVPHFHCPKCGETVCKRNSFSAHLECHRPAEVFNTVAAVINPNLFQHIRGDVGEVLGTVQAECDVTCNLSKDTWCVVQGKWDNVNRARHMLEDAIVMPVTMEIEDDASQEMNENAEGTQKSQVDEGGDNNAERTEFVMPRKRGRPRKIHSEPHPDDNKSTENAENAEPSTPVATPSASDENADGARRSSRRRVLSRRFDEYAVPRKLRKTGPGTADDDELESLSEDEEEEHISIVTVPNNADAVNESQNSGSVTDISSGLDLNIEEDDSGSTTVSLTVKDAQLPPVPVRKVVISNPKGAKKCPACGKMFSNAKKLSHHMEKGQCYKPESGDSLKCGKCDYEAHRTFDLKLHYERHHQEKKWECPVCHKKFGPLYDLKMHFKYSGHNGSSKTMRSRAECPVCHKQLQQKGLQNHIRTVHQNIRPHSCETCGKSFWTKHLLKQHLESHKDMSERVRPYICDICNQGFFAKMALEDHRTKHTGSPKYSCEQCGKQFYYYTGWQRHLVSHTENRPYSCDICKKTFKTSSNLYAHKQSHGQPTFVCRCGKAYQHKHNLMSHVRRCPTGSTALEIGETIEVDTSGTQRFMCGYCTATFNDFTAVQEHLGQHVAAGETDVQMDASMLEQLAVAAVEAGSDDLGTLQQLAMTAMQHSEQEANSQTVLVDGDDSGTAVAILEGQQVLQADQHQEIVNMLVGNQDNQEVHILEVKEVGAAQEQA